MDDMAVAVKGRVVMAAVVPSVEKVGVMPSEMTEGGREWLIRVWCGSDRLQRGDGAVQEPAVSSLGSGRADEHSALLALLLPEHQRHHLRRRLGGASLPTPLPSDPSAPLPSHLSQPRYLCTPCDTPCDWCERPTLAV